ncbi:RNA-directed DNA polymerase, eukaryota, reverse transcriptase zinc-binding domain protein [Tanacetum coccineum]
MALEEINSIEKRIDEGSAMPSDNDHRLILLQEIEKIDKFASMDIIQKAHVKWDIEGDENSKFFHGLINQKRRNQMINGIMVEGNWITNPCLIKDAFLQFYKRKFQAQDSQVMFSNLPHSHSLNCMDRETLERQVTLEEIKEAVWDCGSSKAPGPDGYSFAFVKKYWGTIQKDLYDFVNLFFASCVMPNGANSSFFTLIPKVNNPTLITDFRPISLIGIHYKIIAKILANRLSKVIDKIVSKEQSAFIAGRQILDGPVILSEIIEWYKKRKKKLLIFKVDFEKAFDSISWNYLIHILDSFGFGNKWCSWIKACLNSSRASILINGSPTSEFSIKRGLRQGDPLSPFLFILVMEGLHNAFEEAVGNGLITGVNIKNSTINVSHLFYADDVIITTDWNAKDMDNIIRVLHVFYLASGLKINIHKSNIYGIGVNKDEVLSMASNAGCIAGDIPFNYLGLPIGSNMKSIASWKTLVDRFHMRLSSWKANLLSIGGRLTLIKSVLGSLGIYYLSIFRAPESVLQDLERIRANFFWGGNKDKNKMAWVKWPIILNSFDKGGLNIGSLKAFNLALLQKWRWRLLSSPNALWVQVIKAYHGQEGGFDTNGCSFKGIWANIVGTSNFLHSKGIILSNTFRFKAGCGTRIRFWKDIWVGETPLFTRYNRLYHLDQDKDCLIIDRINNGQWSWNWSRTNLGVRNLAYLCDMLNEIGQLNIDVNEDTCTWSLGPNGTFTVKDARYRIDQNILPTLAHATTWDKSIPRKVNVFMWRLSLDRLPHRLNLSSRGMDIPAISCPSCNANVESANHVFFECDIATDMWKLVFRWCDIPLFQASSWDSFNDWIISWHASKEKKHRFYVITTSVLWWLWRYRNSVTFNSQPLRKSDLFDNVRFSSFSWLHNRDHMKLSWNDWLMYPLSITRNGNVGFKPRKEYRLVPKKPNTSSSGNTKKGVEPTIEVSNSNPFEVLNSVDNDVELGISGGTTNLVNNETNLNGPSFMNVDNSSTGTTPIIDKIGKFKDLLTSGQAILVDEAGNPLKKGKFSGGYESVDEVALVYNDMTRSLASEKGRFWDSKFTRTMEGYICTWMTSEGNTRDLSSFEEETDEVTDLHQILEEILLTECGDGVASIKRRRRDLFSDGVWNLETASECGRLKKDLESST